MQRILSQIVNQENGGDPTRFARRANQAVGLRSLTFAARGSNSIDEELAATSRVAALRGHPDGGRFAGIGLMLQFVSYCRRENELGEGVR